MDGDGNSNGGGPIVLPAVGASGVPLPIMGQPDSVSTPAGRLAGRPGDGAGGTSYAGQREMVVSGGAGRACRGGGVCWGAGVRRLGGKGGPGMPVCLSMALL